MASRVGPCDIGVAARRAHLARAGRGLRPPLVALLRPRRAGVLLLSHPLWLRRRASDRARGRRGHRHDAAAHDPARARNRGRERPRHRRRRRYSRDADVLAGRRPARGDLHGGRAHGRHADALCVGRLASYRNRRAHAARRIPARPGSLAAPRGPGRSGRRGRRLNQVHGDRRARRGRVGDPGRRAEPAADAALAARPRRARWLRRDGGRCLSPMRSSRWGIRPLVAAARAPGGRQHHLRERASRALARLVRASLPL